MLDDEASTQPPVGAGDPASNLTCMMQQSRGPHASERWGEESGLRKKSVGSPSFEGLKGDFERLIKNIGKGDMLKLLFFQPNRFSERGLFFSIRWRCSKKIKFIFNLCVMYTIIKADGISSIFKCVCCTQCVGV
jgi:hypothetical protein